MKKTVAIFMSFLLLLSSSGLAYAQHFCGDHEMMSKITLGKQDLSCGMSMEIPDCDDEDPKELDCCDNEYTSVDTDDTFAKASFDIDLDLSFIIAFSTVFILNQSLDLTTKKDFYKDYSPPPLERDFRVLYETFLI